MRYRLLILLCLLLLLPATAHAKVTVVAIGDSTTVGPIQATSYPVQLDNLLGPQYDVINKGVNGARIADLIARFPTDVEPYRPKYVLILAGLNDVKGGAIDPIRYESQLASLYSQTRAIAAVPIAITITPFGNSSKWTPERESERQTINNWILTGSGVSPTVDIENAIADLTDPARPVIKAEYALDGLHLNATGNGELARQVYIQGFGEVLGTPAATTREPALVGG